MCIHGGRGGKQWRTCSMALAWSMRSCFYKTVRWESSCFLFQWAIAIVGRKWTLLWVLMQLLVIFLSLFCYLWLHAVSFDALFVFKVSSWFSKWDLVFMFIWRVALFFACWLSFLLMSRGGFKRMGFVLQMRILRGLMEIGCVLA